MESSSTVRAISQNTRLGHLQGQSRAELTDGRAVTVIQLYLSTGRNNTYFVKFRLLESA